MSGSFADLCADQVNSQQKVSSTVPPRRQQYSVFSVLSTSQPCSSPVANNQPNDRQGRQPQQTSRRRYSAACYFFAGWPPRTKSTSGWYDYGRGQVSATMLRNDGTWDGRRSTLLGIQQRFAMDIAPTWSIGGWPRLHGHSWRKP